MDGDQRCRRLLAPPIAARLGHRSGIASGLTLFTGTIALLASTSGYPVLGIVLGLAGLGPGIAMPLASDGLMTAATAECADEAAAVQETSFELGGGLGIVVLGTVRSVVYRARLPAVPGVPNEEFTSGFTVATSVAAGLMAVTTVCVAMLLRPPASVPGPTG